MSDSTPRLDPQTLAEQLERVILAGGAQDADNVDRWIEAERLIAAAFQSIHDAALREAAAENLTLRRLLWLRHGHESHSLYGDDGEMQCNALGCMVDFKRDTAEQIEDRWRSEGERALAAALRARADAGRDQ